MNSSDKQWNILIVDDSIDDAELILLELQNADIQCNYKRLYTHADLEDEIKNNLWHAVIVDYFIPGFGGKEAIRLIRKYNAEIPIIVMTGIAQESTASDLVIKEGAQVYIMKNDLKHLPSTLNGLLNNYQRILKILSDTKAAEKEQNELIDFRDHLPLGVFTTSKSGHLSYVNQALLKIFGFKLEQEMLNINVVDLYADPEDRKVLLNELLNRGKVNDFEVQMKKTNGEIITCLFNIVAFRDEKGNFVRQEGIVEDITEKVKLRKELNEQLKRNKYITDYGRDAIVLIDPDERVIFWNPYASELFGFSKQEVLGKKLHDFIASGSYKKLARSAFEKFKTTGKGAVIGKTVEIEANTKSGVVLPVELTLGGMQMENGWGAVGIVRDIRERKQAEAKLKNETKKFEVMMENLDDPVYWSDENFRVLYQNKSMKTHFSHSDDLSKKCYELIYNRTEPCVECGIEEVKKGKMIQQYRQHPKSKREYKISHIPMPNENGLYTKLSVYRDVTELKTLLKKSRESDALKTAFLNNLSHEIRTPLNAISASSQLLQMDDLGDQQKHEMLDVIIEHTEILASLVDEIVDLSRLETGQVNLNMEDVALDVVCLQIKELARNKKEKYKSQAACELNLSNDQIHFETDKGRLFSVLKHLIDNAFKFTSQGFVEIGFDLLDDRLNFYVKDSGIGVPKHLQDSIFENFRQADIKLSRKYEGAGIGLSICKKNVQLMNGEITLESEEGAGSIFYVEIPVRKLS